MCLLCQPLISALFGRHSLRAQTDSLSAHEPNLVAARIYQTRRSYLQVTQSLSRPSIHPSLLPHPPPSHPLPSFLSPGPCKLIKRGRNPTLHTDGITPPPCTLHPTNTPHPAPHWPQTTTAAAAARPMTRDGGEKCLRGSYMKPFTNVMDGLHLASANF